MYERFTDRSRRVLQLANQEARRFNHEYVGCEHILLGLIKEDSGVAANVLKNFNVDLRRVRLETEKLIQLGPCYVNFDGRLPHTPRAKKVLELAIQEARDLADNHVGTEHLLLGLLAEGESTAVQVLRNMGLNLGAVREEVFVLLGKGGARAVAAAAGADPVSDPPTPPASGAETGGRADGGAVYDAPSALPPSPEEMALVYVVLARMESEVLALRRLCVWYEWNKPRS